MAMQGNEQVATTMEGDRLRDLPNSSRHSLTESFKSVSPTLMFIMFAASMFVLVSVLVEH